MNIAACGLHFSLLLQLLFCRRAHFVFLNFSGHGHWKFRNKADVFRNFEMGYLVFAKVLNVLLAHILAFFQRNPCTYFFAVFRVFNSKHLNILNGRVGVKKFLNLGWVNILAAVNTISVLNSNSKVVVSYLAI